MIYSDFARRKGSKDKKKRILKTAAIIGSVATLSLGAKTVKNQLSKNVGRYRGKGIGRKEFIFSPSNTRTPNPYRNSGSQKKSIRNLVEEFLPSSMRKSNPYRTNKITKKLTEEFIPSNTRKSNPYRSGKKSLKALPEGKKRGKGRPKKKFIIK